MNQCLNCGAECKVKYCSHKCAATCTNKLPNRKVKGLLVKSNCTNCGAEFMIGIRKKIILCPDCFKQYTKLKSIHYNKSISTKQCKTCPTIINGKSKQYCDDCRKIRQSEIGRISAQVQAEARRSWSEIQFGNLCDGYFSNVTKNEPLFPNTPPTNTNWDADVLIHDHKIAVLWNGPWHYQECSNNNSLARIQTRDKIKLKAIENFGWTPFVIADYKGKKNLKFVEKSFFYNQYGTLCRKT